MKKSDLHLLTLGCEEHFMLLFNPWFTFLGDVHPTSAGYSGRKRKMTTPEIAIMIPGTMNERDQSVDV